ncbi:hypothetical protein MKL42_03760 [Acinetobacter sp. AOR15_HL]|uniref:hypothetical protein n=1 Tax=unclassified Acinetobacter TaxID=196816 RepID=UPI0022EBA3C0|nr:MULTISPECIES: hypothetical protein [unclassified Acinetobacter]MDA3556635.1 hypothetical protein [Acinetobacter sp. AOR15_HL]MDA3573373.1 hypothetical protein [Acinetobacter sp. AOR14_HL]
MQKYFFYCLSLILIFLICLGVSIQVKEFYKIEGDYLSSFSTLIAALVAFVLYKDWREEYVLNLYVESQKNINLLFKDVIETSRHMNDYLKKIIKSDEDIFDFDKYNDNIMMFIENAELLLLEIDNQKMLFKKLQKKIKLNNDLYIFLNVIDLKIMKRINAIGENRTGTAKEMCEYVIASFEPSNEKPFVNELYEYRYMLRKCNEEVVSKYLDK